jgi:hypothetical protein
MNEHKYRVALGVKRTEDRFLGVKEEPNAGARALGKNMLYHWLKAGEGYPLDLTKEEALELIGKIMAPKMPENLHDLDTWSILKLQACTERVAFASEGEGDWVIHEHLHHVFIGLYDVENDYCEPEYILDLDEAQERKY